MLSKSELRSRRAEHARTRREIMKSTIMNWKKEGLSNEKIAKMLGLSESTVRKYCGKEKQES